MNNDPQGNKLRISMIGPSGVGKTTILLKLKYGTFLENFVPTIGYSAERIEFQGMILDIYDIGGSERFRYLRKDFSRAINCLIYVVDSTDKDALEEAGEDLKKFLESECQSTDFSILVLINKQDITGVISSEEIKN